MTTPREYEAFWFGALCGWSAGVVLSALLGLIVTAVL